MRNKISKIRNNMRKFDIDALLSIDMVNCYYISGFLLDKMSILITYTNVYIFVRSNRIIPENIEMPDNYHIVLFDDDFELKLLNISESRNICNIGIESNNISLKKFNTYKKKLKGITLVPTNYIIESVRFSKTDEEIEYLILGANSLKNFLETSTLNFLTPLNFTEITLAEVLYSKIHKNLLENEKLAVKVSSGQNTLVNQYNMLQNRSIVCNDVLNIEISVSLSFYKISIIRSAVYQDASQEVMYKFKQLIEAHSRVLSKIQLTKKVSYQFIDEVNRSLRKDNISISICGYGLTLHEAPFYPETITDYNEDKECLFSNGVVVSLCTTLSFYPNYCLKTSDLLLFNNDMVSIVTKKQDILIYISKK